MKKHELQVTVFTTQKNPQLYLSLSINAIYAEYILYWGSLPGGERIENWVTLVVPEINRSKCNVLYTTFGYKLD